VVRRDRRRRPRVPAGRESRAQSAGGSSSSGTAKAPRCSRTTARFGSFTASDLKTTIRRDVFTVNNLAHSIAGYFDARFRRE
jgi:hypothetical protein